MVAVSEDPSKESSNRSRRRAVTDAVVIAVLAVLVLAIALVTDAFDRFAQFAEQHESWQLDEIVSTILIAGLAGFIYAVRRMQDMSREVRLRIAAENESTRLAYTDTVTGLPNRRGFELHLEEALRSGGGERRSFSLMLIDLDNFKYVNDVHGHDAGDILLSAIGRRLQESLREGDSAARLGGDEFIVIALSAPGSTDAARMAMRISRTLAAPLDLGGTEIETGASVGVAMYPTDGTDGITLTRRADMALYRAKKEGRGETRFFEPSMDAAVNERVRIESALRAAIRADEVHVHYQPLHNLEGNKLIGFEALARWTDPELGVVEPTTFIQIAEDSALITQLWDLLFLKACRDAAQWPSHLTLSFNISPVQLRDRSLASRTMAILMRTGLLPSRVEIEITESALVREFDAARRTLEEFHEGGIQVALDDFGTGYSSLAQLSQFKFDRIKIDRSFVHTVSHDAHNATLVRAIISIGRGLGLETTAEGIETPEQLAFLRAEGCQIGQGFLFGQAVAPEEALALARGDSQGALRVVSTR